MDIQAAFEKAYWKLEPKLPEDKKDLAAVTLRSIALNYIERKGPKPPKTLLKSINKVKKLDDIVITKLDKGSGVFVMNKSSSSALRSINQLLNQIHTSRIRETPNERKTSKVLPPIVRERKAPWIGCQKNPSQWSSRFRLQEKLKTSPSLWSP